MVMIVITTRSSTSVNRAAARLGWSAAAGLDFSLLCLIPGSLTDMLIVCERLSFACPDRS